MTLKGSGKPQPFSSKPLRSWQERNFACGKNRFGRPVVGFKSKSSLDFCAAKCRPSFPGGKSGLRNEKRPFLVSPSAPQFWSRQKPCLYFTKRRHFCQFYIQRKNSHPSSRLLIKGKALPKLFRRTAAVWAKCSFPF